MLRIANRIPEQYIVVRGAGQSDFGPGLDPWETAAYDLALLDAGIHNCNIMKYTSVLPKEARCIPLEQAQQQGLLHHGMVLESIMAQTNGRQGEHLCAGVGRAHVFSEGQYIGGFAAEYEGHGSAELGEQLLRQALQGIFERRYRDHSDYYVESIDITTQDLRVEKTFGCCLVSLSFVSFLVPELSDQYGAGTGH